MTERQPDLGDRIMADLPAHPGTTAGQMAQRLEANKHIVFDLLDQARLRGTVRRWREPPRKVWRWAIAENVTDSGAGPPVP